MVPDARIVHVSAGSTFDPTLQRVLFLGARAELFRRTLPEKQIDRAIWVLKLGDWLRKQLSIMSIKSETDWAYVWNTHSVWSIAPPHLSKLPPKKRDGKVIPKRIIKILIRSGSTIFGRRSRHGETRLGRLDWPQRQ